MPRQILHLAPQPREQADARGVQVEADRRHLLRQRVARLDELEVVHHLRQPIDLHRIEAERLPHLARRAAAAIGDHVGRHRRAEPAIFLVDVLNHLLAAIAARQIEVDIGPLAALLGQETLEQQIHPHRIDRGDPQAVADGAVGRRPAALHEDVVLPAEIDDVPDDEEVAGELELLDEIELARDLGARLVVVRPVAFARADVGDVAQERRLRFTGRHRVIRKAVAEIGHRVLQAIGELARTRDRAWLVGKQRRHIGRRLQVPLRVGRETTARRRQIGVMVNAGEDVEQRPRLRRVEADAVGRQRRHAERLRQADERRDVALFVAAKMPLELDVHAIAAENADEAIEHPAHTVSTPVERRAPGERDEPGGAPVQLLERQRAFAFRRAQLHARDQPAEIPVAFGVFTENREDEEAG